MGGGECTCVCGSVCEEGCVSGSVCVCEEGCVGGVKGHVSNSVWMNQFQATNDITVPDRKRW